MTTSTVTQGTASPLWKALQGVYMRLKLDEEQTLRADGPDTETTSTVESNPIERLRNIFSLSDFEVDVVLLCAGFAIDTRIRSACAEFCHVPAVEYPTFRLAFNLFEDPHWSALSPMEPLTRWNLLKRSEGFLLDAPLHIDPRILYFLLDVPSLDEDLDLVLRSLNEAPNSSGVELDTQSIFRAVTYWQREGTPRDPILLVGGSRAQRKDLFLNLCLESGRRAYFLDPADLPSDAPGRERIARALSREIALQLAAVLLTTSSISQADALESWVERVEAPIAIEMDTGSPTERMRGLRIEVPQTNLSDRHARWLSDLGPLAETIPNDLHLIAETFQLDGQEIGRIAEEVRQFAPSHGNQDKEALKSLLWTLCRNTARRSMEELATRVETNAWWDDLILPDGQMEVLRQIVNHAKHTDQVHRVWGFNERYSQGMGLSALFAGPSGTGKTMAASLLARELNRDLYQIDLATVVSKYIGETEKHLRRIFDAAERSGAILLFDEADALFGKRSQVRDSHDRYANLEISYLLQRMETYSGIAILTTNMQNAIDAAFQRRLRFIVRFPFPDAESRELIWRRAYPQLAPSSSLNFAKLAQLNVTGGVIRNLAMLSAFAAAKDENEIGMHHVMAAVRTEYSKLDKPLTAAETRGWE